MEITNIGDWYKDGLLGTIESQGTFITAIPSLFQKQLNERVGSLLSIKDNQILKKNDIAIFPNPAKDTISITGIENFNSKIKIEIYNESGQFIKRITLNNKQLGMEYNISDLKNGIYFFRISSIDLKKTIKIIIKK